MPDTSPRASSASTPNMRQADKARQQALNSTCRRITYLNPMRYYADAMRGIYIKGSTLADVWTDAAGLLAIGAAMVSWAILSYKKTT